MPCYNPLPAYRLASGGVVFDALHRHDISSPVELPCGQCLGCRLDRARAWSLRIMHEASLYRENCFVTLTYSPEHLPPGGSLRHADFQRFMKRLRKRFSPRVVRFYMCGEYGEQFSRPHFHACLFNVSFSDQYPFKRTAAGNLIYRSPVLDTLWPFGHSSIGELTLQSAGYTARYLITKVVGDAAASHYSGRFPEYNRMSLRPGIGAGWFAKYSATDVLPCDHVIDSKGRKNPLPSYYDRLAKRSGTDLSQVKADREVRALPFRADNVPSRLRVKEVVRRAAVRSLKREL